MTRFFIARHGEAHYPTARGLMTNDGGELTELGWCQVHECGEKLRNSKIDALYSSTMTRAIESASGAGGVLGLGRDIVEGLQEYDIGNLEGLPYSDEHAKRVQSAWLNGDLGVGFPGGENGEQVIARFKGALGKLAERHPNDSVLIFSHGGVMALAIPHICQGTANDLAREQFIPNAVPAIISVENDAFILESWPGQPMGR